MSLLSTLNISHIFFSYFYCWLWTSKLCWVAPLEPSNNLHVTSNTKYVDSKNLKNFILFHIVLDKFINTSCLFWKQSLSMCLCKTYLQATKYHGAFLNCFLMFSILVLNPQFVDKTTNVTLHLYTTWALGTTNFRFVKCDSETSGNQNHVYFDKKTYLMQN